MKYDIKEEDLEKKASLNPKRNNCIWIWGKKSKMNIMNFYIIFNNN